ncbi:transposase [Streptomyces massasporeus]|uniref:transposase n=1 Tax=Streptomyces massasporeus TaxID=67324 RepID=UPI0036CDD4C8
MIGSTNAVESVNARIRKAVRARVYFPSKNAALKCGHMQEVDHVLEGTLSVFLIAFEGRL